MKSKLDILFCALVAYFLFLYPCHSQDSSPRSNRIETKRPNIVLVFIDDMGWADFSCFGNQDASTPNMDRLAREGMRFNQFYVNSPICSPSRVAISTGQYPARWRITSYLAGRQANKNRGIADWLDPEAPMLARILHDAGYATGHFGKWHMGGQREIGDAPLITEYGFDKSLTNFEGLGDRVLGLKNSHDGKPVKRHTLLSDTVGRGVITYVDRSLVTKEYVSAAISFIKRSRKSDRPFYLNLWPDDVHSPFFPPKAKRGDNTKRQLYHGVLETMDSQLGVLIDFIQSDIKLRDNTLILVCSDNGPELGAGSAGEFRGFKTHLYEGGIRSPLVVWGPGLMNPNTKGTVNTESVLSAIDLVPSLVGLAGLSTEEKFDGENLVNTLLGNENSSRQKPLYFRRPPDRDRFYGIQDCPDLAIRSGRWKVLCEYDGSQIEIYDLLSDPGETRNLIEDQNEMANELMSKVVQWHESLPQDNGAKMKAKKN